jgi:LPS-assembly lipoprotein
MLIKRSLLALFLLTGCGFQPVYGERSQIPADSPIRAGVSVSVASSDYPQLAQQFEHHLSDIVNPEGLGGKAPTYAMRVQLMVNTVGIGLARDGTAARYNVTLDSNYEIRRAGESDVLVTGQLRNVTSFNNPNNQYFSTYISEQDARKRGIEELAEAYRQRLASYTPATMKEIKQTQQAKPFPVQLLTPQTESPFAPLSNENRR